MWKTGDFESHGTQKTSAIGYAPYVGVTQGGNLDRGVEAVLTLTTSFEGKPIDARDHAFGEIKGLPTWTKGEAAGVHAEVIIIRAWIAMMVNRGMSVADAVAALRGRTIQASQPACWCCAKLMEQLGINFAAVVGKKPSTGWRHPLAKVTIPNANLPGSLEGVTNAWLDEAAKKT